MTKVFSFVLALSLMGGAAMGAVIPQPKKMTAQPGEFTLTAQTALVYDSSIAGEKEAAEFFATAIEPATGFKLALKSEKAKNEIVFAAPEADKAFPSEGYALSVTPNKITVTAGDAAGYFYAIQTLRQLLPTAVFAPEAQKNVKWTIPCTEIEDSPQFTWRGIMLDASRTYYTKQQVLRFIDLLSIHKYNVMHFHLVDDQGWRVEIEKYPDLVKYGAIWMGPPPRPGNPNYVPGEKFVQKPQEGLYYTKADIKEIVAFAKARHITVVPEVELPGHAFAALTAYPEFSCQGDKLFEKRPRQPEQECGIYKDVFCVGNKKTIQFLEDVIDEFCEMFDSPYIHIGGDESPRDRWKACPKCQEKIKKEGLKDEHELQTWLTTHMVNYIEGKGRHAIGWDEILAPKLDKKAIVMSWRGAKGGISAASQGYDVIMAPNSHCYFNYTQFKVGDTYEYKRPKLIDNKKVYQFDPFEKIPQAQQKHIIGAEACFWANWSRGQEYMDWKVFPRACVMSEALWTYPNPKARDYEEFDARLTEHKERLKNLGVNYAVPPVVTPDSKPNI